MSREPLSAECGIRSIPSQENRSTETREALQNGIVLQGFSIRFSAYILLLEIPGSVRQRICFRISSVMVSVLAFLNPSLYRSGVRQPSARVSSTARSMASAAASASRE